MAFAHLHLHTEYSLLDGACRLEALCAAAKEMGQTAVAVTDHGNMFAAVEFYKTAKKYGIKPIIGCEVYVAARNLTDKVHGLDNQRYHLVLLCENETGYKNLIKLVSRSWVDGFYVRPRVDKTELEKHHEGLIALSACLAGEIPRRLAQQDYEGAKETALWYDRVFGRGNFYLELQDHGLKEQQQILPQLLQLSQETGIPAVATNDVHYVYRKDAKVQKVLICIQTNHTIEEDTGLEFQTDAFYLKSEEEMRACFPYAPQAIENTAKIAERCNFDFEFGHTKLPRFDVPNQTDHFTYFREKCYAGLRKNYGERVPQAYTQRLEYELSVIKKMGYVDYFLIVADFIAFAKRKGIPVGPGRGSGAGSIAAYCMGITGIDPMRYQLLFERFLNPERVSMPDIDVDFCYERREEVIDYVIEKYGKDHVAQIVTFGTMAARGAIRDVGRVLGIPYNTVDAVSKQVPRELGITISSALQKNPELKKMYDGDAKIRELLDTAKSVEGMPRHASTHAAGVVITDAPVSDYVPLARNDDSVVTQFTMTTIEELGLLKMDFLGLRTLTVIHDAEQMIQKSIPSFSVEEIPLDDAKTYAMFSKGQTFGVFQCESAGLRSVLTRLKPQNLEDIIAVISLYRPGPMDSIDAYIENRHHPDRIRYKAPQLQEILDVTYGCMIYQEQVMQIFRKLAGYSFGRADVVRRAMSKKKRDVMEQERAYFVHGQKDAQGNLLCAGCVANGISEQAANSIFDEMSSFASYAFNKSHSAAYAVVAYRTAYLKCHYPSAFMSALLTSVMDDTNKLSAYIADCNRMGIRVLPPNVNASVYAFAPCSDTEIRFGLSAIKNLGRNFIRAITQAREEKGNFTDFYDFCKRLHGKEFNKRAVEGLIKSGALDGLDLNRREMLQNLSDVVSALDAENRRNVDGQLDFFSIGSSTAVQAQPEYARCSEFPTAERLQLEKEATGLYLSDHPMAQYRDYSESLGAVHISDLAEAQDRTAEVHDGAAVRLLAIVTDIKRKSTKNNTTMAFATVEDLYGSVELLVFPKIYAQYAHLLQVGNVIYTEGRLSLREDEAVKVIPDRISPPPHTENGKPKQKPAVQPQQKKGNNPNRIPAVIQKGLQLLVDSIGSCQDKKVKNLLSIFEGNVPVYLYYSDTKKGFISANGVDINLPLLQELDRLLGKNNVLLQ